MSLSVYAPVKRRRRVFKSSLSVYAPVKIIVNTDEVGNTGKHEEDFVLSVNKINDDIREAARALKHATEELLDLNNCSNSLLFARTLFLNRIKTARACLSDLTVFLEHVDYDLCKSIRKANIKHETPCCALCCSQLFSCTEIERMFKGSVRDLSYDEVFKKPSLKHFKYEFDPIKSGREIKKMRKQPYFSEEDIKLLNVSAVSAYDGYFTESQLKVRDDWILTCCTIEMYNTWPLANLIWNKLPFEIANTIKEVIFFDYLMNQYNLVTLPTTIDMEKFRNSLEIIDKELKEIHSVKDTKY